MTFSLRTILLVTAVVATLLGAFVSRSPLFLEITALLIYLGVAVSLPLAIWHPSPAQRAFWTGFFVVGATCFFATRYYAASLTMTEELTKAFMGSQYANRHLTRTPVFHQQRAVTATIPLMLSLGAATLGGLVTQMATRGRWKESAPPPRS
jgi:hypothetical protein